MKNHPENTNLKHLTALLLAGHCLLSTGPASAATKVWNNQWYSDDYYDPTLWLPPGVPDPADTIIFTNGGTMNITGPVTNTGGFIWSRGTLTSAGAALTIANGATLQCLPGFPKYLRAPIVNHGRLQFDADGYIQTENFAGNSRIVNYGVMEFPGGYTIQNISGFNSGFANHGTLLKHGAATVTFNIGVNFTNTGTVTLVDGMLKVQRGFLSGVFNGPGKTLLTDNHDISGDLTAQNLEIPLANVTLDGARLHGTIRFGLGQLITPPGAAGTTIAQDCTFTLAEGGGKWLVGTITNRGVIQMLGGAGLLIQNSNTNGLLVNHGLIDSQGDTAFGSVVGYPGGKMVNFGEWRKSARGASGVTQFLSGLALENRGVIEAFQGWFDFVTEQYSSAGGTLRTRLNSDTDFGRFVFRGVAQLGDILSAQVTPGYSPAPGTPFDIVTSGGTNGVYAGFDLDRGFNWSVAQSSALTRLTVTGSSSAGTPALFTRVAQVSPNEFDLHLLVEPNKSYRLQTKVSLDPAEPWQFLAPFSSTTSNYVYPFTALGAPVAARLFRVVTP